MERKSFFFKIGKQINAFVSFFNSFFFLKNLRVLTRSKVRFLLILKFYLYNIKNFFKLYNSHIHMYEIYCDKIQRYNLP